MSFANPNATRCETGVGVQASGAVVSTLGGLAKWTDNIRRLSYHYFKKKKKKFIDTNNLTPIDKKWFGSEFRREPVQVVTLAKYRDSLAKPISEGENGLLPFF